MSALRRYSPATLKPILIDEGPNAAHVAGYGGTLVQPLPRKTQSDYNRTHEAKKAAEGKA